MFQPVTLPLWLFVLILAFAGIAFLPHFLIPPGARVLPSPDGAGGGAAVLVDAIGLLVLRKEPRLSAGRPGVTEAAKDLIGSYAAPIR